MSERELVKCYFCGKEIGYGWRLKRSQGRPPLHVCDDCFDVIAAATLTAFPGHLKDIADFATDKKWDEETRVLRYFELGAEEEGKKGETKDE